MKKSGLRSNASLIVLIICILVMVITSVVSGNIMTDGGKVRTENLTFTTDIGAEAHAKLYVPETATADSPAPAVILCHGYTASSDDMEPNAIELSRRGYVVMALDLYGHGETELPKSGYSQAEMGSVEDYAPDLGTYSALQELANYDFVDLTKIGMLGHSMGTAAIQEGAYLAYAKWTAAYNTALAKYTEEGQDETTAATSAYADAMTSGIVLPGSMVLTGYNYNIRNKDDLTYNGVTADNGLFPLFLAPVNMCTIEADCDEFSGLLWGIDDASKYTESFKFKLGTGGANNVESGTYFLYGDPTAAPLSREEAVTAAASAVLTKQPLRAAYSFSGTHSDTYYDQEAIADGIDFFDITLKGGVTELAPADQVWHGRAACGLIGLIAALISFVALALTLLRIPFFASICREEAPSISTVNDKKSGFRYLIWYIIFLLPAPLLYYYLIGYPYYMQPQWFKFLTKFMPNSVYNMAPMNSLMLFSGVVGLIILGLYLIVYFRRKKTHHNTFENTGLKLPAGKIFKALILAIVSFALIYVLITLLAKATGTTFTFFKFSLQPMNSERWVAFLKYLPVWVGFFLILNMVYNSLTRINGKKGILNYILIGFSSFGGLLIMFLYDYGTLFATHVRGIKYIPGTTSESWLSAIGMSFPTALAGIMLFGLLVILPVSAIFARVCNKKTGSVWLGGFLTSFIVLAFTICHMVINA